MRRNLGVKKTLTAAHDCISAWAGLGSALATLLNQVFVPASVFGTLNIVGYLACIAVLHISIPTILSVEAFNTTVAISAITSGFPEYANSTVINSTQDYMLTFPTNFLPWRGIFDETGMLGLFNSSLYEVLDATPAPGQAKVSAVGFNISCGYRSAIVRPNGGADGVAVEIDGLGLFLIPVDSPNEISIIATGDNDNSIYMYTTATVVDSQGQQGSPLILAQQSPAVLNLTGINVKSSQIQFLQCFKSSEVTQSAMVDTQSNTIIAGSLNPNMHKNYSAWVSAAELLAPPQDSTLLGSYLWSRMLFMTCDNDVGSGSEYLMTYLGLDPFANVSSAVVVQLHDIENALSNLLAMIFWMAGHMKLDPWDMEYTYDITNGDNGVEIGAVPVLVSSTVTVVQQDTSHVRLTTNLTAIIVGLTSSVIQMILYIAFLLPSIQQPGNPQNRGLLHSIWIWRNHRKSSLPLRDVQHPTKTNLRRAGLITLEQFTAEYDHRHTNWEHLRKHQDEAIPAYSSGTKHRSICILLHILLVVAYVAALVFTVTRTEHNVIFSLDKQHKVSFLCKVATNAFGTIYYAALVYATQKLAIAYSIEKYSFLTATHDQILAWNGIGSAFATLYAQSKWPTASLHILSIWMYLGGISILHVTTPAVLSTESFNLSIPTKVSTQSIPQWSDGSHNSTLAYLATNGPLLPWMDGLDESKKLGLSNGSLYDVLEQAYPGSGPTQISAVAFNITCGYIPNVTATYIPPPTGDTETSLYSYNISSQGGGLSWPGFSPPGPELILPANNVLQDSSAPSIILYTQNPVYDSLGNLGSPVNLPSSNITVQFLQCSNALVPQLGEVDASTKVIIRNSLSPPIYKNTSIWTTYQKVSSAAGVSGETSLLEGDYWTQILARLGTDILLERSALTLDWGSMNLMKQLGLNPVISLANPNMTSHSGTGQAIYLHDIENALSNLVALNFWIGGHVDQSSLALQAWETIYNYGAPVSSPTLTTANATVEQVILAARLDMSLAAVLISLAVSVLLLLLVFVLSMGQRSQNLYLTNMGFLQSIWVFEHHPELSDILEQVEEPTDDNLRAAGMVTVRLLDACSVERHN
ncbi:hypothetical protein C8R45DRAFT_1010680 [Mycena sanguinolenta]|nr:hypothetical protein C8R45DRAFT_1010680 [Mycena sanguinolenta]